MSEFQHCNVPGCIAKIKDNKWSRIKASKSGWFFSKNGIIICPKHRKKGL